MALPFLSDKKNQAGIAGTIIKNRNPDSESQPDESDSEYSAVDCAHDLMDAISQGDAAGVAKAVKDLMSAPDAESDESEVSPHTYEAQNIKAGQE